MAKRTIFQQLNDLFGPEVKRAQNKSRYSINDKELLKTKSKEDFEYEKLKRQQDAYLSNMWQKVDNEIYQHSIYYETTRLASYADFEGMEFFPEIAAALDIMMEESTTLNSENKVLNIFSESRRVRRILEDLFFNRLDIHTSLPMWTRNTCKYGDNFLFLSINSDEGITGVKQLPNIEISRKENEGFGENSTIPDSDKFNPVTFVWGQRNIEFNAWQIAHFRLLGDDRRLPYGTSMLEKARRIWKQLLLSEDAMLIYRVTRAPERRIFYIDVGNLPKLKAEQYLKDIMARYRNKIVYDSNTGEIRDDRKMMSMLEDFWLPRREGGRGTEITTLPGGENLGQIEDINYFQGKLYQALNVPLSRMQPQTGISFGRATEITRDELKFAKFVGRLRKKFNEIFGDLLRTQLILKGVLTDKDWNVIKDDIQYRYAQDQYFEEMKNAENLRNRIDLLNQVQPFVGAYYSQDYVMKNILRMSDKEIQEMKTQIEDEGPPPQIGMPGMPPGQLPPGQEPINNSQ